MEVFAFLLLLYSAKVEMEISAFAHSGRTDSSGGHKDNKNKSGLGPYHYHCGGYPAHLHTNGVCPYRGGGSSSSSSSYSSTPKTVYATSITAKNVPSKINAGETTKLEASVYPSNAEDKTISWESSDTSVLTVSSTGSLTAVGVGTATITATAKSGVTEEIEIEVYSNAGDTAAGILGLAVIGGGGVAWYYRRKKKKEAEAERNLDYEHHH